MVMEINVIVQLIGTSNDDASPKGGVNQVNLIMETKSSDEEYLAVKRSAEGMSDPKKKRIGGTVRKGSFQNPDATPRPGMHVTHRNTKK